ncbi:MAG: glycosyltransferase family 4 protein [Acidobacteriota bacterium]|nr:glycosyltransferase family 4 protein [Acidobacteriota bacterium]
MRAVVGACRAQQVDTFVDLNFDRNVWLFPGAVEGLERRIHVLHHATQYAFSNRNAAGKIRTLFLREYLQRLASHGDLIVTHTRRATEILAEIIPTNATLQLPYPVRVSRNVPANELDQSIGIPVLLFVGQAREEKGLADLLAAMQLLRRDAIVRVVGPQRPQVKRDLTRQSPGISIDWIDTFVDDAELSSYFHAASLVITPYRNSFAQDGGASGVLLDALAHGKPLLTSDALADQLPAGFSGAVITRAEDQTSLAEGLEHSLQNLARLTEKAATEGPDFIAEHHTFDAYVAELLDATS